MFLGFNRSRTVVGGLAALALVVSACSSSASTPTAVPATPVPATPAPTVAASATATVAASPTAAAGITCGTAPVELVALVENNNATPPKLFEEFTKQYPNVTFKVTQEQFANIQSQTPKLLASDNAPDIIRLPTLNSLVKDKLLLNLDKYVTAFGWDKWPASLLTQNQVGTDGVRGAGSLYAVGLNYNMTGVFYNKKLAAQIGMTAAPKTVAEFEALLAKAKEAKLQPIMQWNETASGGGLAFPLQNLMASYGSTTPINEWIFNKPGATIDTPTNLTAAQHLEQWIKAGYFPKDVNAITYTAAATRFAKGEGVFAFNGDWQNSGYEKDMAGNLGFFAFPSATEGGSFGTMSAPLQFGIAAKAKHADCAAFFYNWAATNSVARQVNVTLGGANPGGPSDLPVPPAAAGSVTNDTLVAGAAVAKVSGQMDFIANATGSIFPKGWTPELQKMVGGKQTAEGLLKAVQAEYVKELAQ